MTQRNASRNEAELRNKIAQFKKPDRLKSIWQLVNTLIPYFLLWYLSLYLYEYSYWAALPVILINSGLLIRIFIIFHDCGHQSFFESRKVNNVWGGITGILTFTPYTYWSKTHARHHATSGNLDKRGDGDIWMMTVEEYRHADFKTRLQYRLYRNPAIMFLLGPIYLLLVTNRFVTTRASSKEKRSVLLGNLYILTMALLAGYLLGWQAYCIIQGSILFFGTAAGVWLFYVQHQFEGVYWSREKEWDFVTASLEGGSFYELPVVLRWFTGSIGYHHIHHLNSSIPNYNLARCHADIPELQQIRPIRLFASFKSLKYRLWDEQSGNLISFREARRIYAGKKAA